MEKGLPSQVICDGYRPGDSIRESDPIGIRRDFIKILSESGLWTHIRIPSVGIR
jgi:hypothetical protein